MSPMDQNDTDDKATMVMLHRVAVTVAWVLGGLAILVVISLLQGCSPWGGVQTIDKTETKKESSAVKDAVDAASRVTVESSVYPSKALVVSGSNNHIQLESPKEESRPNTERKEVVYSANVQLDNSSKSASTMSYSEEIKSPVFYLAVAFLILVLIAAFAYAKMQLMPAWNFAASKLGGLRVFGKLEKTILEHQGAATDPGQIAMLTALQREVIDLKHSLELKKRDDR